jgi:ElaA protein
MTQQIFPIQVSNMHTSGEWIWQAFDGLTLNDLYDCLQLRAAVFVVEQTCPYQDIDGLDRGAWHCLYREAGRLLAYQRSLPPGQCYPDASAIGRVVVDPDARGRGLSRELLRRGIEFNRRTWPDSGIKLGAQAHLQALYESLGFEVCSEPYLEDGIPHVHMKLARHA